MTDKPERVLIPDATLALLFPPLMGVSAATSVAGLRAETNMAVPVSLVLLPMASACWGKVGVLQVSSKGMLK